MFSNQGSPSRRESGDTRPFTIDECLGRLKGVTKSGAGYKSLCPAHDDRNPSLSISPGKNGHPVLHCHAGCSYEAIIAAMGMDRPDTRQSSKQSTKRKIVATYDYCDEHGVLLYQKVRYEPKDFRIRRPDGEGWKWSKGDVRPVLYRLPDVIQAIAAGKFIFIPEGEKDVDRLHSAGLAATTNIEGAAKPNQRSKWRSDYTEQLAGAKRVVLISDNDPQGRAHMQAVAKALADHVSDICVVELPGLPDKGDVSDWLDAGHPVDELLELVEATPPCQARGNEHDQATPDRERPPDEIYGQDTGRYQDGPDSEPPDWERPPVEIYSSDPEAQGQAAGNFSNFSNFSSADRVNNENATRPTDPWMDPQPLRREPPPPEPFPIDALGDVLNKAALAMMEVIQSPAAICANSLLAGASLAVQGHADIVIDGRTFPVSSYFVTVGTSGERKTATDDAALKPHAKRQRGLREVYDREVEEYAINLAAWKKTREEALSSKRNKTMQAKADALRELGSEPQGPVDAILMVEEPTYEGLVKALANGYPSMGLFSDEGGRFLGGHGMNAENQLKMAAGFSKLWDGSPISRTRGGDGNILLYGRRLSVHLMIQPTVSALLFGNDLLLGQGLLSRFLVTWPESNIGKHRYLESNLPETPAMRRYFGRLLDILEAPLPLAEGSRNELAPRQLPLSLEAKHIWIGFHDHVSALCAEGKELHPIKGLAAKGAEHAARLAGVLTLVRDLHAGNVAVAELEAGIELAQFYLGEALRLFDAAADNPDLVLAEKCLAWARNRDCPLTLPDLYQLGPNPVRDKETAKRIISILEDHGWLLQIPSGAEVAGKRRRQAWGVKP